MGRSVAELRDKDLKVCRLLIQELQPVGDEDPRKDWQVLLNWLEGNESRILPRTEEDVLAAMQDGYPEARAVELLEFLASEDRG